MIAVRANMLDEFRGLMPIALGLYALKDSGELDELKRGIRTWAKKDPMDALFTTVFGGGLAFYLAERDTNPNCVNAWDGILYMSTALSVGYDNLFPTTPIGHALATFAQSFGPALANNVFDATAAETDAADAKAAALTEEAAATNRAILARLEDVVRLLSSQQASPAT